MPLRVQIITVPVVATGISFFLAAQGLAAEPQPISGKDLCKISQHQVMPVEADPDHILILQKGTCITNAMGPSSIFDGGQMIWVETADLVKGNGPAHGYFSWTFGDNSTLAGTYTVQVSTIVIDGKPHTTYVGTWEGTGGTGRFANASVRGNYTKAGFISPTEVEEEWVGTMVQTGG